MKHGALEMAKVYAEILGRMTGGHTRVKQNGAGLFNKSWIVERWTGSRWIRG